MLGARLRTPFVSAQASLESRPLVLVRLEGNDGVAGFGEAAPLEPYDGVAVDTVLAAIEACRAPLSESDGSDRAKLLAACSREAKLPQAIAAIDLALWDLAGKREGEPVWRLLGGAPASALELNATIAAPDRAGAASAAAGARAAGFRCLKVKVALGDDAGRLAAVRAVAGPEMSIRIDANGGWTSDEALRTLRALEPVGIELCEEPVRGIDAIARLTTQTLVPISLDESSTEPGALDRRVCDAVCLKVAGCGGISGLLDASRRARQAGYLVYIASTLDGPLGIAAALHAGAVIRPDFPCGLATLPLFAGRSDPLPARSGRLGVPDGPGLGSGLLDFYE